MPDFTKFGEYGLLGLIVSAVIFLLFKVIQWTLATTKDILAQAAKEREDWQKKIGSVDISLTKICDCLDKHDDSSDERGRFVREEHKEMIEVLKRINGYRDGK